MSALVILLSGPPASGKTTLAHRIQMAVSGCCVLSKDDYKEVLFDHFEQKSEQDSQTLGEIAFKMLTVTARSLTDSCRVIVVDNNFSSESASDFINAVSLGRHVTFLQISLTIDADVVLKRFIEREQSGLRHPGHNGMRMIDYIRKNILAGRYSVSAMGIECIELDTTFESAKLDRVIVGRIEELADQEARA